MSHWRSYKNDVLKNTDMAIFEKALANLGLGVNHQEKTVKNSYGIAQVDMALTKNGKTISIGFKAEIDGTLGLQGDFWNTGVREDTFMNKLAQQYNKEMIVDRLSKTSQYSVTDIETKQNGEIELTVACM